MCGLLLGRTLPDSRITIVEDSIALPCDDAVALAQKLAQWAPGVEKRLWAVGYYRRRNDGKLVLDDDDAARFAKELPDTGSVMLVSAIVDDQPVAGFFVRQGADLERTTRQEFPLSRLALRQSNQTVPKQAPGREHAVGREQAPWQPVEEPPRKQRRITQLEAIRWTTLTIVLLSMAALGIQQYVAPSPGSGPPRPIPRAKVIGPELNLSVEGTPDRVLLKWNRNASAIVNCLEGTLSVTEGGSTKILMLKPADLAIGSVAYFPSGPHVVFQLEITTTDQKKVTERVRFLAAGGKTAPR